MLVLGDFHSSNDIKYAISRSYLHALYSYLYFLASQSIPCDFRNK